MSYEHKEQQYTVLIKVFGMVHIRAANSLKEMGTPEAMKAVQEWEKNG
jgi:hypothetical protein